jgi:integrase
MARLTDAAVKAAKAGSTTRDLYDEAEGGLCLRVQPSGRKAWALRIRIRSRLQRFTIGEYPETGLGEARELAGRMKKAARRGDDPMEVLRPAPSGEPSMREAIANYMETKRDNRSHDQEKTRFKLHVEPVLGDKRVDAVTKAELDVLLQDMVKTGMRAEPNRVFTSLSGFWSWAVHQRGYRADNPMAGMKRPVRLEPSQARQKAGTVSLLDLHELCTLWRLALSLPSTVLPDLVPCMIAVPLRREEWTSLRWSEFRQVVEDGWRGWALKIPAERMKGKRPAVVPLPSQAVAILEARRKLTGSSDYVFSVPGSKKPFAGWKRSADALRVVLGSPTIWTPHDIRRSVATALARDVGADEGIIKRILQHSDDVLLGVTAIYQKSRRLNEQAEVLQSWCDLIERVAGGAADAADLVPLGAAAHAR